MHDQQRAFCAEVKRLYPEHFSGCDVLDVGSGDINGNNRYLFEGCFYTGVDVCAGPNVDIVAPIHEAGIATTSIDTIISTEMLEHDPNFKDSVAAMFRILRPGGLMLLTAGGVGRPVHGTRTSNPEASLGTIGGLPEFQDYYKNVTVSMLTEVLSQTFFADYNIRAIRGPTVSNDIYFYGIKLGGDTWKTQ